MAAVDKTRKYLCYRVYGQHVLMFLGVVKSLLIKKYKKERDANYPVSLTGVKQEKK